MRLPRLTTRRLLVIVAMTGIVFGVLAERRARFRRVALAHEAAIRDWYQYPPGLYTMNWVMWHEAMKERYERADRRPWVPLGEDPPGPFGLRLPPLPDWDHDPFGPAREAQGPRRAPTSSPSG